MVFFFKQKTAYEMCMSDWSSDVCSSDLGPGAVTRFKLTLEYDGGGFVGWQRQENGPSVQQAVEEAAQAFCGETIIVHAAGRTDAGVHAVGQTGRASCRESVCQYV